MVVSATIGSKTIIPLYSGYPADDGVNQGFSGGSDGYPADISWIYSGRNVGFPDVDYEQIDDFGLPRKRIKPKFPISLP